jgi:flagellum-specific ATP synthase
VGAYRKGSDPRIDHAVEMWPRVLEFLRQDRHDAVGIAAARRQLAALLGTA